MVNKGENTVCVCYIYMTNLTYTLEINFLHPIFTNKDLTKKIEEIKDTLTKNKICHKLK